MHCSKVILASLVYKKPVYIEVWTDVWTQLIPAPSAPINVASIVPLKADQTAISGVLYSFSMNNFANYYCQAIAETLARLQNAHFPIINVGREVR